jgi:plasmid stability protein
MVSHMAAITLKNIPPDLHRALKKRAEEHHRSLNREIIATLRGASNQGRAVEPAPLIREARALRKKFKRQISPAEIKAWIRRGRL